ncbi:N-acetylglucosaminyl deacetylase, LmbE family [Micromonospora rhizosphaerae]|uniref:N-acetylglucosaminyl deacetylase, LmbE family n=1 Tax=Micromonospora rhizosphaerae TaxID=568872 RepID=A0A1C6TEH0_9ACTN|nr:PIG-L deacetylase family protein [Micromonospora rhizosphaerae]SCL40047.1 N-acetylglucosaminyl deacetylase, LmbE family [Micromonospora rhizosphaerae]
MSFPSSSPVLPDVRRTLAVFAHPDDVDYGCAGTIAGWVEEGVEVAYLIVTRGASGGFDETPREEMPWLREAEQRAAAAAVGVRRVDFLEDHPDGLLSPTPALRRDITAAIRRIRPDRVLTSSPLRRWEHLTGPSHPDHLAVGEATTCAVYPDARNRFAFPELLAEGLTPWVVREIWYAGGPAPDHAVDVTEQYDRKVAAMRAHRSQTAHMDVETWVRDRLGTVAENAGLPAGRMAEAFTVLRTE